VARALGKLPRPPHRQGLRRGRHRPGGDRGSARPLRGQHLWGAAFEDLLATDLPDGRNLAEEYLRRRGWKEPAATRAYIAGLRGSAISLYEVSGLVPGESMLLRDLVRGGAPIRVIDPNNTASDVWGGDRRSAEGHTAYRSAENERYLAGIGKVSCIHRRKPPPGRPMPRRTAQANAAKWPVADLRSPAVRARVEHPFAHHRVPIARSAMGPEKGVMGLVIRTIGIARARGRVTLANMAYTMKRWCRLDSRGLPA
jgi:hypothetical protein